MKIPTHWKVAQKRMKDVFVNANGRALREADIYWEFRRDLDMPETVVRTALERLIVAGVVTYNRGWYRLA